MTKSQYEAIMEWQKYDRSKTQQKGRTFSDRLKHTRKIKNLSQRDVIAYLGIPEKTYSAWERGKRTPPIYIQEIIINIIGDINSKKIDKLIAFCMGYDIDNTNKV